MSPIYKRNSEHIVDVNVEHVLIDPFVRLCDVFGTALIFDFIAKAWNSFRDAFHSNAAAGFTVDWDLQVGHAMGWLIISYVS